MDPLSVEAFEARAAVAEARLAAIEAHLTSGGAGWQPGSSSKGVVGVSPDLVAELKELKQLLLAAKQESDTIKAERDEAVKAQEALKAENSKLQYRVKHLVRAVRDAEGGKPTTTLSNGPDTN